MVVAEEVYNYIKEKGAVLPVNVAEYFNIETLFASAFLSELRSKGLIKVSHLKVGGSPLYYVEEKKEELENYVDNLHEKEQKTLAMLKSKKILEDIKLDLIDRVALRKLKDFAIPLNVKIGYENRLFWKYYLLSDLEAEQIIKNILLEKTMPTQTITEEQTTTTTTEIPEKKETTQTTEKPQVIEETKLQQKEKPIKQYLKEKIEKKPIEENIEKTMLTKQTQQTEKTTQTTQSIEETKITEEAKQQKEETKVKKELLKPITKSKETKSTNTKQTEKSQNKKQKTKTKEVTLQQYTQNLEEDNKTKLLQDSFGKKLLEFFEEKNIQILYSEIQKKETEILGVIIIPSVIGELEYFFYAKNKKTITEKDIKEAFVESTILGYPLLFLAKGKISKNAYSFSNSKLKSCTIIEL